MRNWKEKEKLKKWLERCISLHISMQLYGRNGLDHQGRHVLKYGPQPADGLCAHSEKRRPAAPFTGRGALCVWAPGRFFSRAVFPLATAACHGVIIIERLVHQGLCLPGAGRDGPVHCPQQPTQKTGTRRAPGGERKEAE